MPINKMLKTIELMEELMHDKPPVIKQSKASKYVDQYSDYMLEKLHLIELAELDDNSTCLDISTGAGMLPHMLVQLGHECDATDIPSNAVDKDPEQNHHAAYEYIRTHVFDVDITKYMTIEPGKKIKFSRQYDCIFSTRVVFNKGDDPWQWNDYLTFINNLLEYTSKIIIKWNGLPEHIQEKMKDCIVEEQYVHGIITKHTQELR